MSGLLKNRVILTGLALCIASASAWASPLIDALRVQDVQAVGVTHGVPVLRPDGPPVPGNSWAQAWIADTPITFDFIAVAMTNGEFAMPGLSSFSVSGWTESYRNGSDTILAGAGAASRSLAFKLHSDGDITRPVTLDFVFFSGSESVFTARRIWDGDVWSHGPGQWEPGRGDFHPVPLPAGGLAGLAGLLAIITLRRRRLT